MGEPPRMEAAVGGALGRMPRRSPALIAAAVLLGGICALGLGLVGYRLAAVSGGFDVQRVDVTGAGAGSAAVRTVVERRAAGRSLLDLSPQGIASAVAALPQVRRVEVDRAFPHTLALRVVPERAVAVAPSRGGRVVLAASGRVIGRGAAAAGLPLVAAAPADLPGAGGVVGATAVRDELAVAVAMRRSPRAAAVAYTADGLVARTAAGVEIRFGDGVDIPVKLRVARSVLRRADGPVRYVDVSVPAAPALRLGTPDPQTANAPPPTAPAAAVATDAVSSGTPRESIRGLFG